jgi:hypothetical protein
MADTDWARLKSYTANMPLIKFTCFEEPKGCIHTLTETEWQEYKSQTKDDKSWPVIAIVEAVDSREASWKYIDLLRLKNELYRVYFYPDNSETLTYLLLRAGSAAKAKEEACQRLKAMDIIPSIFAVDVDDGS